MECNGTQDSSIARSNFFNTMSSLKIFDRETFLLVLGHGNSEGYAKGSFTSVLLITKLKCLAGERSFALASHS